jgi:DNA-binding NarL/FixJ family response regulator
MYSFTLSTNTLANSRFEAASSSLVSVKKTRAETVTVLIVEDDRAMRELIKKVIGDLADTFCECSDGSDALALYEKYRPAWVLMDIGMEPVDGLIATSQIKAAWPSARVLIVTAHVDEDLRAAAHRAGACGFVPKENLFEIRHWLAS